MYGSRSRSGNLACLDPMSNVEKGAVTEAIIAGVDDRAQSRDAVELAGRLTQGGGARLELAAVLDDNPVPIDIEPYEIALREHFTAIFKRVDEAQPESIASATI